MSENKVKKPVSRRVIFFEIFNATMMAAAAYGMIMLIEMMFAPAHMRPWGGALRLLPCVLAYPAGRILHSAKPKTAISIGLGLSAALAAIPLVMFFRVDLAWILLILILPTVTFGLFVVPFVNGSNLLHAPQFILGVGVFLIDVLVMRLKDISYCAASINTIAVIFLCAGLFLFNRENLRTETSPDGKRTKFPTGIRRSNTIFLVLFIAVAFGLANSGALKQFFTDAFISIVALIVLFLDWFGKMMGIGGEGGSASPSDENLALPGDYTTESWFVQMLWEIVLCIIIVGIIIAAIYLLIRLGKKISNNLPSLIDRIFGIKQEEEAYIDETEDLSKGQSLADALLNRLKKAADGLKPKPRFEDMPNNREKVRFAYKRALTRVNSRTRGSLAKTPLELAPEVGRAASGRGMNGDATELAAEFVNIYNRARYSDEEISDADAEVARSINKRV